MNNGYTENLADFGYRELYMVKDILTAWLDGNGLPDDFEDEGVRFAFNASSGNVFLVNDENQVAMEADGQLYSWYWLGYHGYEGFLEDLLQEYDNGDIKSEDWEELANICEINGMDDKAEEIRKALKEVENEFNE